MKIYVAIIDRDDGDSYCFGTKSSDGLFKEISNYCSMNWNDQFHDLLIPDTVEEIIGYYFYNCNDIYTTSVLDLDYLGE